MTVDLRALAISLPLPPIECSPNWHGDWHQQRRAAAAYRMAAAWEARSSLAGEPPFAVCTLAVRYVLCGKTPAGFYAPRDCDNALAALKAAQDGLRDGGLFSNDSRRQIRRVCAEIDRHQPHRKGVSCEGSLVEITVTEVQLSEGMDTPHDPA